MPEDDPESINQFLQWVYTKIFSLSEPHDPDARYLEPIRLYKLADKLQINPLQNDLIRALYRLKTANVAPHFDDLVEAIQTLPAHCFLLNLLLAYWTWHIDFSWFERPSTLELLASTPKLAAVLTMLLAHRLHSSRDKSPYLQKVEHHFVPDGQKELHPANQITEPYGSPTSSIRSG